MTTLVTSAPRATPPIDRTNRSALTSRLALKLVMVSAFWGGTFIAGRVLAQSVPPLTAAFWRFLVATVLLVPLAVSAEGGLPRLDRSQMKATAMLGMTGIFLYNVFFLAALARMSAGRTALLVSLNPIVTALAASVVYRERLSVRQWLGIGIALFGAVIVVTRGELHSAFSDLGRSLGSGEILMSLAVLSWAAYTLYSRKALESLPPIVAITYATLWGLAFLAFGAVREIGAIAWTALGWPVWFSVFYLGAVGTVVAFVWYGQGIRAIGPSRTAVFNNLVPAFGVLFSAVLLGEPILVSMLVGGVLAAFGVLLANRRR